MEVVNSKNLKEPIILLKMLKNNSLLVVDNNTTTRYYDSDTLTLSNGFKVGIFHLRYKASMVAFSNDSNYFASITSDCKLSKLYSAKTKKIVAEVDKHHGEVSCVGIDPSSRYMFSCGDDGKTFAIDLKSGKLVFTLPIHVDTVNDIAFSQNSNWVATASYDKKISLFNLATMTPKNKLIAHDAPVMKLRFLNNNRLISVDKNSTAIIWNIYTGKVIERLQGIHDDVIQITTSSDDKFLFLGTALGYILLYDLATYEILSEHYIKLHSSITALEFDGEKQQLIIGTEAGDVLFYDIYEGKEKLQKLLKKKDFEAIQKEADYNPILKYTDIYDLVSNLWDTVLAKAILALEKGDTDKAILLFKHFKNIPSKNTIMKNVMLEYVDFEKFATFAKGAKLPLAYGLANRHPMYKDSRIYKSLEENWKKSFHQAQKYVLDPKGAEAAKQILAPYRGISEKTKLIQELLIKGEVYKRFLVSISQKDFRAAFELIKLNPFLKEFPEYDTIMAYADAIYIKSKKLIKAGDTHSAIKLLRILEDFSDFNAEVHELILGVESRQKFFSAIDDENLTVAYNLMARFEDLQDTKEGKVLRREWNKDLKIANSFAVDGNIVDVRNSLDKYMKISSKYIPLATVFGWCYMAQLENAIKTKTSKTKLENGIKNYMLSFGLQDQIENFFRLFKEHYPESKLNLEHLTQGSISMWRPSMIDNSILD